MIPCCLLEPLQMLSGGQQELSAGYLTLSPMCLGDAGPAPPPPPSNTSPGFILRPCKTRLHPLNLSLLFSPLPSTFSTHVVPLSWSEHKRPPSLSAEVAGASPQAQVESLGWHRRLISQTMADTSKFISYFHLWLPSLSPPPCQVKDASCNFS